MRLEPESRAGGAHDPCTRRGGQAERNGGHEAKKAAHGLPPTLARSGTSYKLACEHTFLTSQGHPYARFRRALDRGNATAALAAAADLEHVGLVDALEFVLLLREDGRRFERAALRWHSRYIAETPDVGMAEAQAVLALLAALRGSRGPAAARSLAERVLCRSCNSRRGAAASRN